MTPLLVIKSILMLKSSDYYINYIINKMMFFKPQILSMLKPARFMQLTAQSPLLSMQVRPFVKSMEERKEDTDRKAF
jgi:hypothetical protein